MKIAVFHNLPPGGSKRTLYEEVKYLSKHYDLHVFEFKYRKKDYFDIKPYAKKVFSYHINLGSKLPGFLKRLEKDIRIFMILPGVNKKIARKINSGGYDIAIVHTEENIGAPHILRYLKIPNLYFDQEITASSYIKNKDIPDDLVFYKRYYEYLIRWIRKIADEKNSKSADRYLVLSNYLRRYVKRVYKRNARVIYPGVDTDVFKRSGEKKKAVLFVGNDNEIGDINIVKRALSIVGQKYEIAFETLEVNDNKRGVRDDKKLAIKYSQALCTICTREHEGFGYKAIESMACETPVIAVSGGGYLETVENDRNGFLVKRSPEAIADKIVYLIENNQKALRMGKIGRETVKNKWRWENHFKKLEVLIHGIVNGKKMLISGQDSGGYGGAEVFIYQLSKALKYLNHRVKFSVVSQSPFEKYLNSKLVDTNKYRVPVRMDLLGGLRGLLKFVFYLPYFILLEYLLLLKFKKENGKYVLLNGFTDKIIVTPIAKYLNLKTIWLEYGPYGYLVKRNFGIPWFLYRMAAKMPDKVIAPSENTESEIVKNGVFRKKDITVIPCGIEIKRRSFPKNKRQEFVVGNLSRIEAGKGQDVLIKTIPFLIKMGLESFRVVIAGAGNTRHLEALAIKLGVEELVEFTGFVKDSFKTIAGFDVFVFPTTWKLEGFGLVPLEAMMTGVPVVASNYGPVPEVVGEAGLVVKPTPEATARAIMRVRRDINLRKMLVKKGFEQIKKFDINKVVSEYEKTIFS